VCFRVSDGERRPHGAALDPPPAITARGAAGTHRADRRASRPSRQSVWWPTPSPRSLGGTSSSHLTMTVKASRGRWRAGSGETRRGGRHWPHGPHWQPRMTAERPRGQNRRHSKVRGFPTTVAAHAVFAGPLSTAARLTFRTECSGLGRGPTNIDSGPGAVARFGSGTCNPWRAGAARRRARGGLAVRPGRPGEMLLRHVRLTATDMGPAAARELGRRRGEFRGKPGALRPRRDDS